MLTVKGLRDEGFKVQVRYERVRRYAGEYRLQPYSPRSGFLVVDREGNVAPGYGGQLFPRGGKCTVTIQDGEGVEASGESICHINDNFDRKAGLKLALARARGHYEQRMKRGA